MYVENKTVNTYRRRIPLTLYSTVRIRSVLNLGEYKGFPLYMWATTTVPKQMRAYARAPLVHAVAGVHDLIGWSRNQGSRIEPHSISAFFRTLQGSKRG